MLAVSNHSMKSGVTVGVMMALTAIISASAQPASMPDPTFDVKRDVRPGSISANNGGRTYNRGDKPDSPHPSLFRALEEQLGLKLESATGPVEFLVIERAGSLIPD